MLIRPKSASRTRTRHVASETSSFISESLPSNPNLDKNDVMESRLSETSLQEDMIPSIQAIPFQLQMEINESTNRCFSNTRNETRKRSISSQDNTTRKFHTRDSGTYFILEILFMSQNMYKQTRLRRI